MAKTLAIMGFSLVSMLDYQKAQYDEIWSMNHAYVVDDMPFNTDGSLAVDRHFEIHKEEWYRRGSIKEHEDYWQWLIKPHPFPIMMIHRDARIPASQEYPFDAVVADCLGHLWRRIGGEVVRQHYLTNSFDYMMALAIHLGEYDTILPFGIEMDPTETEYAYQKPGGSYWTGLANGRGIDVIWPEASGMCMAKIYGYESVPAITAKELDRYLKHYEKVIPLLWEDYQAAAATYDRGRTQILYERMDQAMGLFNSYLGAQKMAERCAPLAADFLGRQQIESLIAMFNKNVDEAQGKVNSSTGKYQNSSRKKWHHKNRMRLFNAAQDAKADMWATDGSLQLLEKLLLECDMVQCSPEVKVRLKMKYQVTNA